MVNDEQAVVNESNEMHDDLFFRKNICFYGDGSKTYGVMSLSQSDSLNLVDDSIKVVFDSFDIGVLDNKQIDISELWDRSHVLIDLPYSITSELLKKRN